MHKKWFMIFWVALLLGQVPLSGSVVICTTEDGRAHFKRPDHHAHGESSLHSYGCGHENEDNYSHVCVEPISVEPCCQDVTLNFISPSLVQAKRVGHSLFIDSLLLNEADCLVQRCTEFTSFSHHTLDTGPDIFRSVVLLI